MDPLMNEDLFVEAKANMFVINTRTRGYEIYLDLSTDRELVLFHGYPKSCRKVSVRHTQKCIDLALRGESGFFFQQLSKEDYQKFNECYSLLNGTKNTET